MSKLGFGDIARDKVTGFTGVVMAHTRWLTNVDRLTLQPRAIHEGVPVKPRSFDIGALEFMEKSEVTVVPVVRVPEPIELGDLIKHPLTGLSGLATGITEYIEGCCIIQIQPKGLDKEGVPIEPHAYDERVLEVLERANPKPEPVRTGGPRPEPPTGRHNL